MTILNIMGVSDDNRSVVAINGRKIERCAIIHKGNVSVFEHRFFRKFSITSLLLGGERESPPLQIERPSVIFNSICDPDTNRKTLIHAAKIVDKIDAPVINHPKHLLHTQRNEIFEALKEIEGLKVPKTVRISPRKASDIPKLAKEHGFVFPYIVRPAGTHGGRGMILLESEKNIPELESFPFDGSEYYLTQFVDFISEDGIYRKYRFFVIDSEAVPRHMIASRSWNIHSASRDSDLYETHNIMKEEETFVRNPPQKAIEMCKKIAERLKLDYFGIDCNISEDGKMVIFEVNACMRYATPDPKTDPFGQTVKIEEALAALIEKRAGL